MELAYRRVLQDSQLGAVILGSFLLPAAFGLAWNWSSTWIGFVGGICIAAAAIVAIAVTARQSFSELLKPAFVSSVAIGALVGLLGVALRLGIYLLLGLRVHLAAWNSSELVLTILGTIVTTLILFLWLGTKIGSWIGPMGAALVISGLHAAAYLWAGYNAAIAQTAFVVIALLRARAQGIVACSSALFIYNAVTFVY